MLLYLQNCSFEMWLGAEVTMTVTAQIIIYLFLTYVVVETLARTLSNQVAAFVNILKQIYWFQYQQCFSTVADTICEKAVGYFGTAPVFFANSANWMFEGLEFLLELFRAVTFGRLDIRVYFDIKKKPLKQCTGITKDGHRCGYKKRSDGDWLCRYHR